MMIYKMKKVIQVMPIFELAGAQTMCENLVMELKKNKNIKCIVITFFKNDCAIIKRLKENGIEVICLNKHRGLDIKIIFKLAYYFKRIEPDVIHTHLSALQYVYFAFLMQKNKKNIKIVHTIHNEAEKENKRRTRILQRILFKKEIVIPVAISKTIQKTVIKEYGLSENQVPIVYNSINISKCIPKDINRRFKYKFLNIGRLTEQKNQIELLEIFSEVCKKYPSSKLTIVGEGQLRKILEKKIYNLNLKKNVTLFGSIDSCFRILNESDIFLMTSKYEGLPMTVIEAMGTGLPIVSYDAGGIKDIIIDNDNGFVAKDRNEFLTDIELLIENEEKRKSIIKKELLDSKKFNSNYMANKYKEIYEMI